MIYLIITMIFVITIILSYIIIMKIESKFLLMCIHTYSVFLANVLHVIAFNKLFYHCKHCLFFEYTIIKGIDFSRSENMLGVTIIDGNDAKIILVLIVSLLTTILLISKIKKAEDLLFVL